ncbi:SET domain-containing protein [Candidatus Marinimicrobia bacterium]|nr:SET domain-containing protein [Candidatus Neomarinimicrobiota bacterium]
MSNFEKLKTFEPLASSLTIKDSPIHGLGLFAITEISSDTELGISHVKDDRFSHGYIRTPLGGFFNHSKKPNCKAVYDGDFIKIITLSNINSGDEITVDYTKHDWIKKNQ